MCFPRLLFLTALVLDIHPLHSQTMCNTYIETLASVLSTQFLIKGLVAQYLLFMYSYNRREYDAPSFHLYWMILTNVSNALIGSTDRIVLLLFECRRFYACIHPFSSNSIGMGFRSRSYLNRKRFRLPVK